jgi:hypothetical protein
MCRCNDSEICEEDNSPCADAMTVRLLWTIGWYVRSRLQNTVLPCWMVCESYQPGKFLRIIMMAGKVIKVHWETNNIRKGDQGDQYLIPGVQLLEFAVSAEIPGVLRCPKPSKPLKQLVWCLVVNNKVWCNLCLVELIWSNSYIWIRTTPSTRH